MRATTAPRPETTAAARDQIRAPRLARTRHLGIERGLLVLIGLYLLTLPLVTHDIRAADEIEYFAYVRSLAFDRDLDFGNEYQHFFDRAPEKYTRSGFKKTFLDARTATGKRPNFGPIGTALLWAPFFGAGHLVALGARALGSDVAVDGYTQPYLWAITFGSALYALAGLALAYRLCRAVAGQFAAFWATLTIWLATPVLFYSHLAPGYSHAASLFAIALFLYLWQRWRDEPSPGRWVALGAAGGLAAMVREQDALFLAVPAVYAGLGLLAELRRRDWAAAWRTVGGVALMGLAAVVTFLPQLATYWVLNGNGQPSEDVSGKMNLVPPFFWHVLFSSRNGLLFWSPVLALALVGLALLVRRNPRLGLALLVGFLLTWYINGAIKTWSTAGSFGARRFLNCTPLFVVGLGVLYDRLATTRWRALAPLLSVLAIGWNAGLIVQFVMEYMNRQGMAWPLVLRNQFTAVPRGLPGIIRRVLTDRGSFYRP